MNDYRNRKHDKRAWLRGVDGFAMAEILATLAMTSVLLMFGLGGFMTNANSDDSPADTSIISTSSQAQLATQGTITNATSGLSDDSNFAEAIMRRVNSITTGNPQDSIAGTTEEDEDENAQDQSGEQGNSSSSAAQSSDEGENAGQEQADANGKRSASDAQGSSAASSQAADSSSAELALGSSEDSVTLGATDLIGGDTSDLETDDSMATDSTSAANASMQAGNTSAATSSSLVSADEPSSPDTDEGNAGESADEAAKATQVLKTSLKGVDGTKYSVVLRYGEDAGIPEGAHLKIVEVNRELTEKEAKKAQNKKRPFKTEVFMSQDDLDDRASMLGKALDLGEDGHLLAAKLLHVTVVDSNDSELAVAAPVELTLTTNLVAPEQSSAIEVAGIVYDAKLADDEEAVEEGLVAKDGKTATSLEVQDLTGVKDPKTDKSAADRKVSKVKFETAELGEFAVATIAEKKAELLNEDGATVNVLGPRFVDVMVDAAAIPEAPEGAEALSANTFRLDPEFDRDADLWVTASTPAAETASATDDSQTVALEGDDESLYTEELADADVSAEEEAAAVQDAPAYAYAGYLVENGALADQLFGESGTEAPVAFNAADGIAVVRSEIAADQAQLAQAAAPEEQLVSATDQDNALAAAELQDESAQLVSGTVSDVAGIRGAESRYQASTGETYTITALYGADAGIPDNAKLEVSELSGKELDAYATRGANVAGLDSEALATVRAFDISFVDADTDKHIQPTGDVKVFIKLDAPFKDAGDVSVVHFQGKANGKAEVVDSNVNKEFVEFTTDSFSVYVVLQAQEEPESGEGEEGEEGEGDEAVLLENELVGLDGNWATWKIKVNPAALPAGAEQPLTLEATISDNQSIDYASITATDDVTYDYSGHTGTFVITEANPVEINYRTRIMAEHPGDTVVFSNAAVLFDSESNKVDEKILEEPRVIYPSASDVASTAGIYMVKFYVYEDGEMQAGIGGAQFILLDENHRPMAYKLGENAEMPVTFTTDDTGHVEVRLNEEPGDVSIEKNTQYYLEMIKAPEGYKKDNSLYGFVIKDNPDYSKYEYYNGDTLKVRLYPEAASLNVSLRFSGNYNLSEEQQNGIDLVLQTKNTEGNWEEVERHSYSEFNYGSLTFEWVPDENMIGSKYRVIQENLPWDLPDSVHLNTTYYLIIGSGGSDQDDVPEEFTITEGNVGSSFNVVINNECEEHELTITKMDKESGAKLQGAVFTVKKAKDDTEVKTYTTDSDGVITISGGSDYASETLYYVVETDAPEGYLLPVTPEKAYFYFCNDEYLIPTILEDLPEGETAVNLTETYDSLTLDNQTIERTIPVMKTWQGNAWPTGVHSVVIGLYQSVNGAEPTQVMDEQDEPRVVGLTEGAPYNNTAFTNLPSRDGENNTITYSIKEEHVYTKENPTEEDDIIADYVQEYGVSDAGVYIVRNSPATTLTVTKEWYNDETKVDGTGQSDVTFDIYRSTTKIQDEIKTDDITNEEMEDLLVDMTKVRSNLKLDSDDNWETSISDLPEKDDLENTYYYYVHETIPSFGDEVYVVDEELRTVLIKNQVAPETVNVTVQKAALVDDPRPEAVNTDFNFTLALKKGTHPIREYQVANDLVTNWDGEVTFTLKPENGILLTLPVGVTATVTEAENPEYVVTATGGDLVDLEANSGRVFSFDVTTGAAGKTVTYTNTLRVICKVIDDSNIAKPFESLKSALAYIRANPDSFTGDTTTIYMLEDYTMPYTDVFDVRADENITLTTAGTDDSQFPFRTDRTENTDTAIITRGSSANGSMLTNAGTLNLGKITLDGAQDSFPEEAIVTADGGLVRNTGTLNLTGDTTLQNSATSGRGGAIYSTGTINMSGGNITGNSATNGSAIYLDNCTLNMTGGNIGNNTGASDGAVVVSSTDCKVNLSGNPVIFDNSNSDGDYANVYLGVDSDYVINVVDPGLGTGAKIGVRAMETHREIGDQFASAEYEMTANLNAFVNDMYEYRGKLKDGTSTNVVWDGLTLTLEKVVEAHGANPNDTFTITLTSSSIRKNSYTIDGNLDNTVTPTRTTTPGTIELRGVKAGNEISIYPLPVGTYTITEAESNYEPTYVGHNVEADADFDISSDGSFSLQGNSTVTVTNTRRLAAVNLTKTLEDKLKAAEEPQEFSFTAKLTEADGTAITGFTLADGVTTNNSGEASFTMSPSNEVDVAQEFKAPVGATMTIAENNASDYRITIVATTPAGSVDGAAIADGDADNDNIFSFLVTDDGADIIFNNARKMATIELKKVLEGKVSKTENFAFTVTLTRADGSLAANYSMYTDADDPTKNIMTDENGQVVIPFSFGDNEFSKSVELTIPDGTELEVEETDANGHADWYNTTHSQNGGPAQTGKEVTISQVSDTDDSIVFTNSRKMQTVTVKNTVNGYSGNTAPFTFTATVTDGRENGYNDHGFTDGVMTFELATGQERSLVVPYGAKLTVEEEFVIGYETSYTHGSDDMVVSTKDEFNVSTDVTVAFTNNQLVGLLLENKTSSTIEGVQVYIEKKTKVYRVNASQDQQTPVTLTNRWASFDIEEGESILLEVEHEYSEGYIQKYIVKGNAPQVGYYYTITNEPSYHEYAQPAIMRVYNVEPFEVSGQLRFGGTYSTVTFTEQPLVSFDVNGGAWTTEMEGYHDRDGDRQVYQYAVTSGEAVSAPQPNPVYPTAEGISFLGWTADETYAKADHSDGQVDSAKLYDFSTPVTDPVTLFAIWKKAPSDRRTVTVENAVTSQLSITATLTQNSSPVSDYLLSDNLSTDSNGIANFSLPAGEVKNLKVPDGAKLVLTAAGASCMEYSSVYSDADNSAQSFTINSVDRDGTVSFIAGICKITDSDGNILYDNTGKPAVYGTLAAAFTAYNGTLYTNASHTTPATQAAVKMLIDEYAISSKHMFPTKNAMVTTAGKYDADFPYVGVRDCATLYRASSYTSDCLFTLQDSGREITLTEIILDGRNVPVAKNKNGSMIYVNHANAILHVTTGATFRNVEFAAYDDGNNARGGAIYINYGTLNIDAGLFSNLKARRGGAINAEGSAILNITGKDGSTRFEDCATNTNNNNNAGGDGGAIYYGSSQALTINGGIEIDEDSEIIPGIIFDRCKALTKFGDGGAICADTGYNNDVTIIGCEFNECTAEVTSGHDSISNTSGNGGGAIAAYHVKGLKAQNCAFNSCDTMLCGGAIVAMVKTVTATIPDDEGTISIDNCDFDTCNCKAQGGSIAVYQDNNGATGSTTKVLIESSSFTNCSSGTDNGSGGAIQCYLPCMKFEETTFMDCWAGKEGGAVNNWYGGNDAQMWTNARVEINLCNFIRCRAEDRYKLDDKVHFGGGIATKARTLLVNGSYFEDCVSVLKQGGAIHCSGIGSGSSATIADSIFRNCSAKDNGGAVTANNETMTVTDSYFYGCSSFAENGGAIYHGNSVNSMTQLTTTIADCTFSADPDPEAQNSSSCSAAKDGGAVWTKATTATIEDCSFTKCTADINGGAIRTESATVNVNNCTITECEASGNGGGLYFGKEWAAANISGGSITGGHAVNGSAVYIYNNVSATFSDTTITGNIVSNVNSAAVQGHGNGSKLYFERDVKVENNTCSADSAYDHDVLMQRVSNNDADMTIIQTTSNGLGANAHVGVYVPDNIFERRGTEGRVFGKYGGGNGNANLDCFFNNRNDRLLGYQASNDGYIYWGMIICKITDEDGNTLLRGSNGRYAVYQKLSMAFSDFPNGFTYDENRDYASVTPACIKMIIESYDIPETTTISVPASQAITLTTAEKEEIDGLYQYEGEDYCIINRGKSTTSLFTVQSDTSFTLRNITLDGGAIFTDEGDYSSGSRPTVDGGLITTTAAATININSGAILQNTAISNNKGGAAVFLNNNNSSFNMDGGIIRNCLSGSRGGAAVSSHGSGSVIVHSGRFENCNTLSGWGGAIFCKANQLVIGDEDKDYTVFINCKTEGSCGGAISHQHGTADNASNVIITHVQFSNCSQEKDDNSNGGGALYTNAKTVSVQDSTFTDCRAKNNGGAISVRDNGIAESLTISGCTFTNCKSEKRSGGAIYSAVATLTIQDNAGTQTVIDGCTSLNEGGAIRYEKANGIVNITNAVITDCYSQHTGQYGLGGALYTASKTTVNLTDCSIDNCKASVKSGAIHMNTSGSVLNIAGNTVISRCYAKQGGAIYLNSGVTLNLAGSPEFTKNGYTTAGQNATEGACIYLEEGSTINLSGSPKFSRNNITNIDRITNGGTTDYVRQDLYLAGYRNVTDAKSINVVGELTGDTIWVWPAEAPHKGAGEQFAMIDSSDDISDASLQKFRNALADNKTGCTNGEYLAGVRLPDTDSSGKKVYWSKMYDISFMKKDNKAVTVPGAEFTLYTDSGCTTEFKTEVSADGEFDTDASGDVLGKGTVEFAAIPMGVYYMKETQEPISFKANDTVYIVLVGSPNLAPNDANRSLWEGGGPLNVPNAATLVARYTTNAGKYYGIYPLGSDGKADVSRNLASANMSIVNIRNDYQAWFKKVDDSSAALPNAEFTIYSSTETYANGYPILTLWSRDGENYPDPVKSADGTANYKDLNGDTLDKGVVYFRELPIGTYFLLETVYPERNGNNRKTFYVEEDRVFKLEVKGEEGFTLSEWQEDKGEGASYSPVEKAGDYYTVQNTEAVCKLTDGSNNLLYKLGHDGTTKLPALYATLEAGFAASGSGSEADALYSASGESTEADEPFKLQALKDFTMNEPVSYSSSHPLTFTTASTSATKDKYVFITNRTSDTSRAEIKRNYSDSSTDASALISVSGGASLTLQNIKLNGQKTQYDGRAIHATDGSLTIGTQTQIQNFRQEASSDADVRGGAILMDSGTTLTVNGGSNRSAVFSGNEAINSSSNGSAGADGGAIAISENCTVNLTNAQFTENKATAANGEGNGGAVSIDAGARIEEPLKNVVFRNNNASHQGGALHIADGFNLTVDGGIFQNNSATNGNGGAIRIGESGTLTLKGYPNMSNNSARNGGAVAAGPEADVTLVNGSITSNRASASGGTGGNGGAFYIESADGKESKLTISAGSISSNSAVEGSAIYAQDSTEVTISGGTFKNNAASGNNGGAINVGGAQAKIFLSGSPTIYENYDNLSSKTQRRDVVLSNDTNEVIQVTDTGLGDKAKIGIYVIDGTNGALYKEHGLPGKPFGTFASKANLNVFVNDRNTALYGVYNEKKDDDIWVYWISSGVPVAFKKIDGFGDALSGATFSLYTDSECTDRYEKEPSVGATAVSADGESAKNLDGVKLGKGTVLFEEIPDGVYYMQEKNGDGASGAPTGFAENASTYVVLVGDAYLTRNASDSIWGNDGVLSGITQDDLNAQKNTYSNSKSYYGMSEDTQYAIFQIDGTTKKAVANPDIATYGIMNASDGDRKVILKKTSQTGDVYAPLGGATFEILRYDMTKVSSGTDSGGNPITSFTSGNDGVYFVDDLPYGTYYLHETEIPQNHTSAIAGADDNWYILTVNADGVGYKQNDSISGVMNPETKSPAA